jgi:hypothetical protein
MEKEGAYGRLETTSRGRRADNRDLREKPYHQDLLKNV